MNSISFQFHPRRWNEFIEELKSVGFNFYVKKPTGELIDFVFQKGVDYAFPPVIYALWSNKKVGVRIAKLIADIINLHEKGVIEDLHIHLP